MLWVQWKTRRRRFEELRRTGVDERSTFAAIMSCKGPWRLSASSALHRALRNQTFAKHELVAMATLARLIRRTAVYGPVCTVVWEGWRRKTPPYPD